MSNLDLNLYTFTYLPEGTKFTDSSFKPQPPGYNGHPPFYELHFVRQNQNSITETYTLYEFRKENAKGYNPPADCGPNLFTWYDGVAANPCWSIGKTTEGNEIYFAEVPTYSDEIFKPTAYIQLNNMLLVLEITMYDKSGQVIKRGKINRDEVVKMLDSLEQTSVEELQKLSKKNKYL